MPPGIAFLDLVPPQTVKIGSHKKHLATLLPLSLCFIAWIRSALCFDCTFPFRLLTSLPEELLSEFPSTICLAVNWLAAAHKARMRDDDEESEPACGRVDQVRPDHGEDLSVCSQCFFYPCVWLSFGKLWKARTRPYRSRALQVNAR